MELQIYVLARWYLIKDSYNSYVLECGRVAYIDIGVMVNPYSPSSPSVMIKMSENKLW